MNPLIITCAITGAETDKKKQPALPTNPSEQAFAAKEACEAGARVIHLHVRDEFGRPTQCVDRFRESMDAIREAVPDVILQMSTGGAVGDSIEDRLRPLSLKPDMATLNMGSLNFGDDVFINHPKDIERLAKSIYDLGIVPELEIYEVGMLETAARYLQKGILKEPLHFQFVLGVPGGLSGRSENLEHLLKILKSDFSSHVTWGVAGIGRFQFPMAEQTIELGGHVRVGFEDNIYIEKGVLAETNAALVQKVVGLAQKQNRMLASFDKARAVLIG